MSDELKNNDEDPGPSIIDPTLDHKPKKLDWHERETPVTIHGTSTDDGVLVEVTSEQLNTKLELMYPDDIWEDYPGQNQVKLVDNITYVFTAHLPFLLEGNIRLDYKNGYPHIYSWAKHCFVRFLPAYWYVYGGKRGTKVFPLLKVLLNSRSTFKETPDVPPKFPASIDENVILPFTFGKDSFLTYCVAKEMGLNTTLVYFNEPTEPYASFHKLKLIKYFQKQFKEHISYLDNPLGNLREFGSGWFGWEMALTSWTLLSLPFAYASRAGYIVFSNPASTNDFFYDEDGLRVMPDFEESTHATEEMSLITQALSEGEVYTTTFLQGLSNLAIVGILKDRYRHIFPLLMSCWAETEAAKTKRWCADCTKCGRIYAYLTALGVDPIKEAGYEDNMYEEKFEKLFSVFDKRAVGTGADSFGIFEEDQALAFFITYLRGNRNPLIMKFLDTKWFAQIMRDYPKLIEKYFTLIDERITPPQWKEKIDSIYNDSLGRLKKELLDLYDKGVNRQPV